MRRQGQSAFLMTRPRDATAGSGGLAIGTFAVRVGGDGRQLAGREMAPAVVSYALAAAALASTAHLAAAAPATTTTTTTSMPWWRREHLLPAPASVTIGDGRLKLTKGGIKLASVGLQSSIVDAALARLPPLLFGASVAQCRLPPCNATRACNASAELGDLRTVEVNLTQTGGNWSGLAHGSDESYQLQISAAGVASVVAPTAAGAVHGLETFAQLVKIGMDGVVAICSAPLTITDAPRFAWRGMMVDSSRHYLPVPLLLKMIDALSAAKGNVLHWHFMDGTVLQPSPHPPTQRPAAGLTPYWLDARCRQLLLLLVVTCRSMHAACMMHVVQVSRSLWYQRVSQSCPAKDLTAMTVRT
jgi:hypothetical protein